MGNQIFPEPSGEGNYLILNQMGVKLFPNFTGIPFDSIIINNMGDKLLLNFQT